MMTQEIEQLRARISELEAECESAEGGVIRLAQQVADLVTERNKLMETWIDPDTETVWSPPTAWAYAAACKALEAKKQRITELEAELERLNTEASKENGTP
jgi:uncharacterized protein YhaN